MTRTQKLNKQTKTNETWKQHKQQTIKKTTNNETQNMNIHWNIMKHKHHITKTTKQIKQTKHKQTNKTNNRKANYENITNNNNVTNT